MERVCQRERERERALERRILCYCGRESCFNNFTDSTVSVLLTLRIFFVANIPEQWYRRGKKKKGIRMDTGRENSVGGNVIKLALKKFTPIIFFRRIIIVFLFVIYTDINSVASVRTRNQFYFISFSSFLLSSVFSFASFFSTG